MFLIEQKADADDGAEHQERAERDAEQEPEVARQHRD
jgi:hypothetical protein